MPDNDDPIARAIAALTEAEQAAGDRVDFGAVICDVVAAVAANAGGTEALLAGRPGSWEAERVRQLLHSAVGLDDEYLWKHRTIPLRLTLDVAGVWWDFGLMNMYDDEYNQAIEGTSSEDEQVAEQSDRLLAAMEKLCEDDLAAYTAAYAKTVKALLAERGLDLDVEVVRLDVPGEVMPERWSPLLDELHAAARERTPLPATGQKPDWSQGQPAAAVRAAGRTYTERVKAADQASPDRPGEGTE